MVLLRIHPGLLAIAVVAFAACSPQAPPATPMPTAVPNPCAPENIGQTAGGLHGLMQQFEDESALAASVPRSQLATHIAALQDTRRQMESLRPPDCVALLRELALTHMDQVIGTMLAFLGGSDQGVVTQGIGLGRQQHDQYVLELARLLGVTAIAVAPAPGSAGTPAGGQPSESVQVTPAPSGFVALNTGPLPITMRAVPATEAQAVGTLVVGESAVALGGSSDGQWIQVVVPGRPYESAWVLASLVQIAVPTPRSP